MNNNPIGIFDSGVGGLTVFSKLIKILPEENYIYFGDTKNLPYGSKTQDELIRLAKDFFDYFSKKKVKAVIMACNTTSATIYEKLKDKYNFIMYPVIQSAAKKIAELEIERIGILATPTTANSLAYTKELQKYKPNLRVFETGCPEWVSIVENKLQNQKNSRQTIKKYLDILLEQNVEKIVFGCTHYPYLLDVLKQFISADMFIDPAQYFVEYIYSDLKDKNLLANERSFAPKFVVSSEPERFKEASKLFYSLDSQPELISLAEYIV